MPVAPTPSPPLAVLSPPDAFSLEPPVDTRIQRLPFEALSWENFERLCHRLTAREANVEYCARYGRQGDAQEGIDIFARRANGRYHCLQAKRHRNYGAAKLRDAVDLFVAGSWAPRTAQFTIAVQAALRSPEVQEEIERQAARLATQGIQFAVLDGESLTDRLREHSVLVDDFFGRNWVVALLGRDIANDLGARLDGSAFAQVRAQLARVYDAQFQFVDPGNFGSISEEDGRASLTLLERFLRPDILVREMAKGSEAAELPALPALPAQGTASATIPTAPANALPRARAAIEDSRVRRLQLAEWFGDGDRLVVLGDAGCGKSTMLRVIALDLLHGSMHFPELASRWGRHVPIYLPFARWSSQVARDGGQIGIKEIVRRSLEQLLTRSIVDLLDSAIDDGRVLLLIDGLDEWSNEQAARSTLSALVTIVEAHQVPVVVSGRPRGLSRIGTLPANWKRGAIAPLSVTQQAAVAGRWFQRYAAAEPDSTGLSDGRLRTNRFMAELARDTNLRVLAAVPLLLIGLVTLALRGQTLPRTKTDTYDQLVRVLLEVHPINRATAAGDTSSRFRHATDPEQRRAAIAKLAFHIRDEASDAGVSVAVAREILRIYLASPQGFDLTDKDAEAAAGEILSVNAETQGMLVEKGPKEVGFVHASFEEFLSAEHIGGWPFREIEAFVVARSGDSRWRNVLVNLLGSIQRRDEFDRLVNLIEEHEPDELLRFHKEALLGDIAFSAMGRSPATARRLALAAMQRVEEEDWLPARREALTSVLKGLADPALKNDVEHRLERWLPAHSSYHRAALIAELGAWNATEELQETLWRALHDEDCDVQRAAAAAYARSFAPSKQACHRLLDALAHSRDHKAAAAMLESLALGWSTVPHVISLFEEAYESHRAELRLIGILGLAEARKAPDEARDVVLGGQYIWSNLSFPYQNLAAKMLVDYWPNDDTLIKSALRHEAGDRDSPWAFDAPAIYLLRSATERTDVRAWILDQFNNEYPFNFFGDLSIWGQIGRFAKSDPEIRAAANNYWSRSGNHALDLYKIIPYVKEVADDSVAEILIRTLLEKRGNFECYWALTALLDGWGHHNPTIKPAIESVLCFDNEESTDLVSLIPRISSNKLEARERLLRMSMREDVRRDFLAEGLEACGCGHADEDAVAALLAFPSQLSGPLDNSAAMFRNFGQHHRVRALALEKLRRGEALAAIAAAYANDPEFGALLFKTATPLPVDLRTQVIEVAATGAAGTMLEAVLSQCMLETDPELCIRMVIAQYRSLSSDAQQAAKASLLASATAVGSNYEVVRAAALAGLITIGALNDLVPMEERGKPVELATGGLRSRITTVERLICERFGDFEIAFGDSLPERFRSFGINNLAKVLVSAPSASPQARTAFLALVERGELPRTPTALRALAAELPRSDLLLTRCLEVLQNHKSGNEQFRINAEIGVILREQFHGNFALRDELIEYYKAKPCNLRAITLAVFAPEADVLPFSPGSDDLGETIGDWLVAAHVGKHRADAETFCALLEAMLTRPWRTSFDAQPVINRAIEERLHSDPRLERLLIDKISEHAHPSVSGSFARYLAAAGKLGPEARNRTLDLLRVLGQAQRLPVAGYDAIDDRWRATRTTLLEAVTAGLELA